MAKALFRRLRGELNGFYLNAIHNSLNLFTKDVNDFFGDFSKQQFNLQSMDSQTIYNICKFAGVFLPRLSIGEGFGALKMTESARFDNKERSERGLLSQETETFSFVHTTQEDYEDDINTIASRVDKSSLIGEDDDLIGYISSEENVLDDDGNVRTDKILSAPPAGVAYSNYYGDKFLYLSEMVDEKRNINIVMYYDLYKIMQWIRYNGANIVSLTKLIEVICPSNLVTIQSITKHVSLPCFIVNYKYDINVNIDLKNQRLATLLYIMAQKFPQFVMQEVVA